MPNTVISIENISKLYRLGTIGSGTFQDDLKIWYAKVRGRANPISKINDGDEDTVKETIWALQDINFSVNSGESLGIIGRNGAGKSTLLKILSRVTTPTSGHIRVQGRIASLLEVGTGFHPELTGRENVFLNGAIMGMDRTEVLRKFDEIVDFSGVEKFIDTPVKRYSSGMYVRLAFAVAAHLEPDILIVDEVLSVGDAAFQKKSLGKMEDVTNSGRTVLFVSHNLQSVISMCKRCVWLDKGLLVEDGITSQITQKYLESSIPDLFGTNLNNSQHYGNGKARFTDIEVNPVDKNGNNVSILQTGGTLKIEVSIECFDTILESIAAVIIYDKNGYRIIDANTALNGNFISMKSGDKIKINFTLHNLLLKPDTYRIGLWIGRLNIYDIDGIEYASEFNVEIDPENIHYSTVFPGLYQCNFTHKIEPIL